MSVNDSLSYKAFVQDVIAHMLLALFPLATKMLVEYQDKWVAILFYGTVNFVTALLLSWMTLNLTLQNAKTDTKNQKYNIREFYMKRLIMVSGMDIFSMVLALLFNKVGIFLYLVSPLMEFWMNYKRGVIFETAIANGYTFEDYIGGKNQGEQRKIRTKEPKH